MEEQEAVLLTEIKLLIDSAKEKVTQLNGDTNAITQAKIKLEEAYLWAKQAAKK